MQKILQKLRELSGVPSLGSAVSLKKKTTVCSTEAAAVSIVIHVLFAVFAGSWVAIKYVQKRDAAFSSENIARPKLERRQLQMPVKVQNLQKKSQRPKVSSRMASVSKSSFALPDMSGLGGLGGAGLAREGGASAGGRRELSSMGAAGSLGFGVSGVNFFGARSKGEKLVFILDASRPMMEDGKGGFNTYKFAKDKVYALVNGLSSATLFNVMVYNEEANEGWSKTSTVMFGDSLVPATPENREALKKWLEPLNANPQTVTSLEGMKPVYKTTNEYDSMVGKDATVWVKPVQAAMEQGADNIFVLCAGFGRHFISNAMQREKFGMDPSKANEWLLSKGWTPERVAESVKKMKEVENKANQALAKENETRAKNGLPPKILTAGGFWTYMTQDLKLTVPEGPPTYTVEVIGGRKVYDENELLEHMNKVYEYNYIPKELSKPQVHFVRLVAEDDMTILSDDGSISLKKMAAAFRGRCEFLRGARTMENLLKNNDLSAE